MKKAKNNMTPEQCVTCKWRRPAQSGPIIRGDHTEPCMNPALNDPPDAMQIIPFVSWSDANPCEVSHELGREGSRGKTCGYYQKRMEEAAP